MRNKKHRFLSLLLVAVMVLCLMPAAAFAADFDNSTTVPDGEYSGESITFDWSGSSGKTKLSVEKVIVAEGKATAVFVAAKETLAHFYYLGHTAEVSSEEGTSAASAELSPEEGTSAVSFPR